MSKKTVKDIDLKGKKVFVRCDFNVPMDENQKITDNRRIVAALPTIKYLVEQNCKVILASHLGRPKGEVKPEFSLAPVAKELSKQLGQEVLMAKDVIGESAKTLAANLQEGQVMLLENVRFHREETDNDPEFAKELASMAEVFVNDAFGTAHRAHSSTEGVSHFVKEAVAGFLMQKEIEFLSGTLENPKKPFVAILGGAKVSDKIGVIENLLEKVDKILIGGGMAFTFLKAQGFEIGKSICEDDKLEEANNILKKAEEKNIKIVLPKDVHVAKEYSNDSEDKIVQTANIPVDFEGMDIGLKTIETFIDELEGAKTILWNGPLGVCEFDKFRIGTEKIAESISKNREAISIVGGGDSVAVIKKLGLEDNFSHISTGGGASLELLEGKALPGLVCLTDKN